jgi:hypothetical protein
LGDQRVTVALRQIAQPFLVLFKLVVVDAVVAHGWLLEGRVDVDQPDLFRVTVFKIIRKLSPIFVDAHQVGVWEGEKSETFVVDELFIPSGLFSHCIKYSPKLLCVEVEGYDCYIGGQVNDSDPCFQQDALRTPFLRRQRVSVEDRPSSLMFMTTYSCGPNGDVYYCVRLTARMTSESSSAKAKYPTARFYGIFTMLLLASITIYND